MKKHSRFSGKNAVSLTLFCCTVLGVLSPFAASASVELSVADCIKCHKKETGEIAAKGMAHKEELDCQSCHENHRPKVADNIPSCNDCHSGEPHYEIQGCTNCHNPHAPLDVILKGDVNEVCRSCHGRVYKVLSASKAKHRNLSCMTCHAGPHKSIPLCTGCHVQPHSASMLQRFPQCGNCHGIAHNLN